MAGTEADIYRIYRVVFLDDDGEGRGMLMLEEPRAGGRELMQRQRV